MKTYPVFYLISTAGFPNLGDEWITLSWLEAIFKKFPEASVFLDIHFPSGFAPLIQTRPYKSRVCCMDLFWQTTYPYAGQPWDRSLRDIQDIYGRKRSSHNALRQLSLILPRIAHIHFLGGGYFASFWQHHFLLLVLAGLIKQKYRLPVYWTGGSLCPIEDFQLQDLLPFLSHFDYLSFRDAESIDKVKKYLPKTPHLTSDDLILGLALDLIRPPASSGQPAMLINLQSDFCQADSSSKMRPLLLEKIRFFQQNNYRLFYFEFNPECDLIGYQFLSQTISPIELIPFEMLWKATALAGAPLNIVHPETYALGSRFHFHYYLAWHDIPGEFIAQTPYYDIKHKSICDSGSNWLPLQHSPNAIRKPSVNKRALIHAKLTEFDRIYAR